MRTVADDVARILGRIQPITEAAESERATFCGTCGSATGCSCSVILAQRAAGFYRDFLGASLDEFPPPIADAARRFLVPRAATRGLFVVGPTGTGKTRLCAAIAGTLPHGSVVAGLARSLVRSTWNPETQDATIRRLATAPVLILDDLGREGRPTQSVCATLHEILSERNGNYLPTIATSNLTIDTLAQHYDEAIADRLRAWSVVVLNGKSRRGR